ncbi:hypothetical protein JCM1393_19600 [Clostridium carnis]
MSSYFKMEFKRALLGKSTLIGITIVFCCLLTAYFSMNEIYLDGINTFITILFYTDMSILIYIAPILAVIPFVNSYILDKESGMIQYIYIKMDIKQYLKTKIIVNGLMGGLVFLIPEIIALIHLLIVRGIDDFIIPTNLGTFSDIYIKYKLLYVIVIILTHFLYGIAIATLGLGVTVVTKNKYLGFLAPFLWAKITASIFPILGLNSDLFTFNIGQMFYFVGGPPGVSKTNIVIYLACIFVVGCILVYFWGEKRYE